MGNLETENLTRKLIFKAWEDNADNEFRPHLGASIIGRKCERQLYYSFRWAKTPSFPGRVLKLFNRGHTEEERFVADLNSIGCNVMEFDADGNQWRFEDCKGHFGGSADGIIASGVPEAPKSPHIVEMKTHSEKSFNDLVSKGVKESKHEHFIQMNTYMGLSGRKWGAKFHIKRALYMAVNKNNDDLYCERIRFDPDIFEETMEKAEHIIFSDICPPPMPQASAQWYECKFCDYYGVCHQKKFPEANCRTCVFSTPVKDGKWECSCKWHDEDNKTIALSGTDQKSGCGNHLYLPSLIDTWATPIDGTNESIVFEVKGTDEQFVNGFGDGYICSKRLHRDGYETP